MTIASSTGIWAIGDNWPWPQVRFTSYYILAIAQTAEGKIGIYELTNSNNTWTAVEKALVGNAADILSINIADFNKYYLITVYRRVNDNDDKVIYQKNVTTGDVEIVGSSTLPVSTSCCNYLGQLILGGLSGTSSPWDTLSPCSVAWSDIGSIDSNPADNVIAGFAVMPWDENGNGEVYAVKILTTKVRVYGDRGICDLVPYTVGKTTGFGVSEMANPGILSADAVDGDEMVHGYVDTNYDFHVVTSDKTVRHGYTEENLGYRDYMKTFTQRILVRYDPYNKRFYISDGLLSYVYNGHGMYSTHQCVSSIGNYKGLLCGFFKDNSDNKIRLTTNSFDFGHQSMQTIEAVEAGLNYSTTSGAMVSGAISMNYDYKDDFTKLDYVEINPRGIFTQKATGREFKIHLQADYDSDGVFSLSSLMPKIKFSDKRNIRGRLNVN